LSGRQIAVGRGLLLVLFAFHLVSAVSAVSSFVRVILANVLWLAPQTSDGRDLALSCSRRRIFDGFSLIILWGS
jgi:hypothetical protein